MEESTGRNKALLKAEILLQEKLSVEGKDQKLFLGVRGWFDSELT